MVEHDLAMVEIGVRFSLPAPNINYIMPNTRAAKKALRVSLRKRVINQVKKNRLTQARRILNKLFSSGVAAKDQISQALNKYFSEVDKAAKTNTIHTGKADRLKSRITLKAKKVLGEDKYETAGVKKEKVAKVKAPAKAKKVEPKKPETKKEEPAKKKVAAKKPKAAPAK